MPSPPCLTLLARALFACGLVALTADSARAQWEIGAEAIYSNVLDGTWAVGGRINYHFPSFALQGKGDYYFADCGGVGDCSLFDLQLNGIFFLTRQQAYEPYLGAGLSIQPYELSGEFLNSGSQTATGPVVLVGTTLGFWGRAQPFLEGKWLFKGDDLSTQFLIEFGLTYELGQSF